MQHAADILSHLASYSVLGGQSNLSILNYIEDYLKHHEIDYQLVPNEEHTKASLFCRIGPAVDGGIILSGHMDVVPVEGQPWTKPPFELTMENGKYFGRGTADMKGFLSCCLSCVAEMKEANLQRPIYLAFSYDEEIGCLAAPELVRSLLDYYEERPYYAVIGEPSMLQPVIGHKGICVFETIVNGSAGHSSRIKQEVSAVHEACRLVMWLEQKMDQLITEGKMDTRFDPPHSSIHIGTIQGGTAFNIIADECRFQWDVRVLPFDDVDSILAEFKAHCRARESRLRTLFPDFYIQTEVFHPAVPPLNTPEDQAIVPLIQKLTGQQDLITVSFASEAGQFSEAGLQAVICGPGSIEQAHRADEYITAAQLAEGVYFIQKIIREFSAE